MNITDHIVSLLKSGKNVELNGFGAFIIKTQDAYLDESTNTFYPAKQTVEFQPYTEDKGNIVELIARKECVDENTARRMWQNYSGALTEKLQSQHSHTFPELGDMRLEDGEYRFYPIDGLNLLGNNESYKPIVGVEKFETNAEEDPFAAFDNPESVAPVVEETIQEPEPESEPEPVNQDEPTETEETQPEEQPESEAELEPEPVAEVVAVAAETIEPTENAPAETSEPTPSPAPADEVAPVQPAENKEDTDNIADDLQNILDEEPDTQKLKEKNRKNKRGIRIIIILLIILLLLLWGGAAFYYFFIYKKNANPLVQDNDKPAVAQTDSTLTSEQQPLKSNGNEGDAEIVPEQEPEAEPETDTKSETLAAEETTADASNDNSSVNNAAADYDYNKFNSAFAYDLSTVTVNDPDAVETNKSQILKRLSGKIKAFVTSKQYSTAADKLQAKLGEFVTERLEDKFGSHPEDFQIADLMPYTTDNFVRKYVGDELQTRKQRRVRYEVIEEILENNILGQYLDELVNAGEVSKDVFKAPPAPVYTAPLYTSPKQGFDVIAGTYRDKQSAMKMASNLRKKGAGAYVIERGGLYYVSAGSAPSRTAADKVLFQLKTWYTSNLSIKQW